VLQHEKNCQKEKEKEKEKEAHVQTSVI